MSKTELTAARSRLEELKAEEAELAGKLIGREQALGTRGSVGGRWPFSASARRSSSAAPLSRLVVCS
jgi:hypothetical protein